MKKHKPITVYLLVSIITLVLLVPSVLAYKYAHITNKSQPFGCIPGSKDPNDALGCGLILCPSFEGVEAVKVFTYREYKDYIEYTDRDECGGRESVSYYPRDILIYAYANLLGVSIASFLATKVIIKNKNKISK
jgi:hypothetical protein